MTDADQVLAANAAFYAAFAQAEGDVTCIHPGWPAIVGRDHVIDSYRGLLANPAQVRIDHSHELVFVSGDEARLICIESVGGGKLAATNLFRRIGAAWKLTHHQASPIAIDFGRKEERPPKSRLN